MIYSSARRPGIFHFCYEPAPSHTDMELVFLFPCVTFLNSFSCSFCLFFPSLFCQITFIYYHCLVAMYKTLSYSLLARQEQKTKKVKNSFIFSKILHGVLFLLLYSALRPNLKQSHCQKEKSVQIRDLKCIFRTQVFQ